MDLACKQVISKIVPEKFYKSLASRLIGFSKITSLDILTHLITEYAELDDDDAIQLIDRNMKTPINGETLFEDFIEQGLAIDRGLHVPVDKLNIIIV